MLPGCTDSKHLGPLADSVFRLSPIPIDRTRRDLKLVRDIQERLPTASFLSAMRVHSHGRSRAILMSILQFYVGALARPTALRASSKPDRSSFHGSELCSRVCGVAAMVIAS